MRFLYVANWKMTVSYAAAQQWHMNHGAAITKLAQKQNSALILCPSFPALNIFSIMAHEGAIALGAQDCSPFPSGAYTGDVDALSLKQIGCGYCIVGHSERRRIHKETNDVVAQKCAQLQLHGITPIICIGETAQEKEAGQALAILHAQLAPVLTVSAATQGTVIIAYEPVWAIGSGIMPSATEIEAIAQAIGTEVNAALHKSVPILYGGSVTPETIRTIRTVSGISGVLIGSASTDFHSLEKIVS